MSVLSGTSSASLSPDLVAREGIAGGPPSPPPPPPALANGLDMAMMTREVNVVTADCLSAVSTNRYHVSSLLLVSTRLESPQ